MITFALQWAARGLPVFPLQPRSKIPFRGTNGCKDATRDEDIIGDWWKRKPRANIGVATGNGFFVVDLDGEEAQYWFVNSCGRHGEPDPTLTVKTARGYHFYYWAPVEIPNSAGLLASHIDVRGIGGYIVAAPSVHPSGFRYSIIDDLPIAEAPRWLTDLAVPDPKECTAETPFIAAQWESRNPRIRAKLKGVLSVIGKVATARPGERNALLYWGACRIKEADPGIISQSLGVELLIEAGSRAGLPAVEAKRTIASALRGGPRYGG